MNVGIKEEIHDTVEHIEGAGEAIVCPVCSRPLIIRNGEAICESGMCRHRVVEGCCGD